MNPPDTDRNAAWSAHRARVDELASALAESTGPVRLRKPTSNLFRPREDADRTELDVASLNHVIEIDTAAREAEVEGMTTTIDELTTWQFDGPHLRDFAGNAPTGAGRDAGAIELVE